MLRKTYNTAYICQSLSKPIRRAISVFNAKHAFWAWRYAPITNTSDRGRRKKGLSCTYEHWTSVVSSASVILSLSNSRTDSTFWSVRMELARQVLLLPYGSYFYKEFKKLINASRCAWSNCSTALREPLASPPCQMIASMRFLARPSCRKKVCPLTCCVRPIPHSGGVRHSLPSAMYSPRPSPSSSPMSCNNRSVYG